MRDSSLREKCYCARGPVCAGLTCALIGLLLCASGTVAVAQQTRESPANRLLSEFVQRSAEDTARQPLQVSDAIEAMLLTVSDENPRVRIGMLDALARFLADENVAGAFITALDDEDQNVREAALKHLAEMERPSPAIRAAVRAKTGEALRNDTAVVHGQIIPLRNFVDYLGSDAADDDKIWMMDFLRISGAEWEPFLPVLAGIVKDPAAGAELRSSAAERLAAITAELHVEAETIRIVFPRSDADGDGELSREEFREAVRRMRARTEDQ